MHKILFVFIIVSTLLHALYNPFFVEDKPRNARKVVIEEVAPKTERKNIVMTYFGFISTNIEEFALVSFNDKTIVIKNNDSLYNDTDIFKIKKITSNYILVKDKNGITQTVYFSSEYQSGIIRS